MYSSYNTRKG